MVMPNLGARERILFGTAVTRERLNLPIDALGNFVEAAYKIALRDYDWELGGEVMIGVDHFLDAFLLSKNFAAGNYFRKKRLPVSKARRFLKREHLKSIKGRRAKELWYTFWYTFAGGVHQILLTCYRFNRVGLITCMWGEIPSIPWVARKRRQRKRTLKQARGVRRWFQRWRGPSRYALILQGLSVDISPLRTPFVVELLEFLVISDMALKNGRAFVRKSVPMLIISPSADVLFKRAKALCVEKGDGQSYSLYHIGMVFLSRFIENQTLSHDKDSDGEPVFENREEEWMRCFRTINHLITNDRRVSNAERFLEEYVQNYERYRAKFKKPIENELVETMDQNRFGPEVGMDYFSEQGREVVRPKNLGDKSLARPLRLVKKRLGKIFSKKGKPPVFNFSDPYSPNYMSLIWCIRYGKNMTIEVLNGEGKEAFGRDFEMFRVLTLLGRRIKNNSMLLGEPGVGKTAVVEGLASAVVEGATPGSFAKKVFVELDVGAIMASTQYRGDLELKIVGILAEGERYLHLVYFADEFHSLCGAGGGGGAGSLDITNMLKPALARGTFAMVAATTNDEFQAYVQKDAALERRFTPVQIGEPSELKTLEMLVGAAPSYENFHKGVCVPLFVLVCAVSFAAKYIAKDRYFPDKAFDLVDDSASVVQVFLSDSKGLENSWHIDSSDWFWCKVSALESGQFQLASRFDRYQRKSGRIADRIGFVRPPVLKKPDVFDYLREHKSFFDPDDTDKNNSFFVKLDGLCYRHTGSFLTQLTEAFPKKLELDPPMSAPKFMVSVDGLAQQIYDRTECPVDEVSRKGEVRSDIAISKFEDQVRGRIVGQDLAVEEVAVAVTRCRTGIRDRTKPIAVLFFSGPTGTGKTEIARTLAEFFFRDSESILFLDMTEFCDGVALSKLIGAPPGYVGMDQGGVLSNFVRRKPFSLVLFDELEKGHFTCFDLLLGVFDDARMADGCGLFVDFTNTMLISTSNAGASYIQDFNRSMEDLYESDQNSVYLGKGPMVHVELNEYFGDVSKALPRGALRGELTQKQRVGEVSLFELSELIINSGLSISFRPEFLNRLDCVCPFEEFNRSELFLVAMIMFQRFADRTMTFRNVVLVAERRLLSGIAYLDLDLAMGARPVRRAFTKKIEDPLTNMMISRGAYPVQSMSVYLLRSAGGGQISFVYLADKTLLKTLVGLGGTSVDAQKVEASLRKVMAEATKTVDEALSIGLPGKPYLTRYGPVYEPWTLANVSGGQVGIYTVPSLGEDLWKRNYVRLVLASQMKNVSALYTLTMFG